METLTSFYQAGRAQGTFETGVQNALARILVDPRFLYRFEREPANENGHRGATLVDPFGHRWMLAGPIG